MDGEGWEEEMKEARADGGGMTAVMEGGRCSPDLFLYEIEEQKRLVKLAIKFIEKD